MLMPRCFLGLFFLLATTVAHIGAQPSPASLGPRIGTRVPDISGVDQFGQSQTLQTILGDEGAMLVFFRSADW